MKIQTIDTGLFKLDGGAMFGVVPKTLWEKKIPADSNNLCNWAARCLLIEEGNRLILVDTGLGNKQSDKFFSHYYRSGEATLESSIKKAGYWPAEVTDVLLTHLHFDHVGGAVVNKKDSLDLAFKNANYWVDQAQWDWAMAPNPREKASFLPENLLPIQESGHLKFVQEGVLGTSISFERVFGHTEAMVLPIIKQDGKQFLFAADLIPSHAHLPLAWVMSYDVRPLESMIEKERILAEVADQEIVLIFEHDATIEAALIERGSKGFQVKEMGDLSQFL